MTHQIPLAFNLLDAVTFANFFFTKKNQELYFALQDFLAFNNNTQENFFYLWGYTQAGKTHLLQACCNEALKQNMSAMYISLADNDFVINSLDNLENLYLLCLDNLNFINNNLLEEKIFHLFNKIKAKNHKLIVSANCVPNDLLFNLLDLKSRMSWGITYHLHRLDDREKIEALMMRAQQIGLNLEETIANFLLTRVSRNTGKLFNILEKLDNASLAAKRKLTIPFVKTVLNI